MTVTDGSMASPTIQIGKLVGRLDGGSSRNERLQTLKELRILAKKNSEDVGLFALQKTMDMLRRDGGNVEECQDILELVHRLVENRDNAAATENTILLLSDTSNVELLLDLLEHEDILIGVTASQILTELHSNNGVYLEKSIQQCPDGIQCVLMLLCCIYDSFIVRDEQATAEIARFFSGRSEKSIYYFGAATNI